MTASPSTGMSVIGRHLRSRIVDHTEIAPGTRRLVFEAQELARDSSPGQFVHVLCGDSYDPLLRRPFSILDADPESGRVSLLYEIRGRGTTLLAAKSPGEMLDVLGPFGQGFRLPEKPGQPVVIVAGGVGVAPLCFLTKRLSSSVGIGRTTFLIGARTQSGLLCVHMLSRVGADVRASTDDGSTGHHGFVTDLLAEYVKGIDSANPPMIYACGPMAMLKSVAEITNAYELECQISVETKMACGVGACMSCVVKVRSADSFEYVRACKEGPVFDADQIVW